MSKPIREARVRAAMQSGMTELAAQELADKLEHRHDLEIALNILGDLIDWFGVPDWSGPPLQVDLGKRIADLMEFYRPIHPGDSANDMPAAPQVTREDEPKLIDLVTGLHEAVFGGSWARPETPEQVWMMLLDRVRDLASGMCGECIRRDAIEQRGPRP